MTAQLKLRPFKTASDGFFCNLEKPRAFKTPRYVLGLRRPVAAVDEGWWFVGFAAGELAVFAPRCP